MGVWPRLDGRLVSQNPREVYALPSPGQILSCAYTICSHDQISIFFALFPMDNHAQTVGYKTSCIIISFLVLWSNDKISSLIHILNGSEYLTKGITQVFNPFIRFLLYSFVSHSFLVLFRYSFLIFSFISTCFIVSASNILKYLYFSFPPSVRIFSWFGSPIPSVTFRFPLFIISIAHFLWQIPISWLYILNACFRVPVLFHFRPTVWSCMYIRWLIFSCDLLRLYPPCVFSKHVVQWHHRYYK